MCIIYLTLLHILASIVGTYRLLLLVHFKYVRFVFSVTMRSFRDESPVYSLTFVSESELLLVTHPNDNHSLGREKRRIRSTIFGFHQTNC